MIFLFCALINFGTEEIVNYEKYGKFYGRGTARYRYIITDFEGLKKAVGEGIFPNFDAVRDNPLYKKALKEGKLKGNKWDFVNRKRDYLINFFKWATTDEQLGVKLFYVGYALEHAGYIKHAIKAYYAILVHAPRTISYSYWGTPLYLGKLAIDRIKMLTRRYPELGIELVGAKVEIKNMYDNEVANDRFVAIDPGKLVKTKKKFKEINLSKLKVVEVRGGNKAKVVKYENGHWQLFVDGKPFFIRGMSFYPNVVGKSPDYGTLTPHRDWQFDDYNNNGVIDLFETWVDKNKNNKKDPDEPVVGDPFLMKQMGVNTIRVYHHIYNKELFRKLWKEYGFYAIVGDFLGAYAIGSGAPWGLGTNYADPKHRKNMLNSVKKMVMEFKDEPYVIMWVLGNENNYGVACNADKIPEVYYEFVNEVARFIKKLDPTRPVALCNGDLLFLDVISQKCPDVDVFGVNAYRGALGFGESLWLGVKQHFDRPVLITEYGCPAYSKIDTPEAAELGQLEYHRGNWEDIWFNRAGGAGVGNCIGGVIFEWVDEWWKAGAGTDPNVHDTKPQFGGPFLDGWSYEEWYGICSQGDGSKSPFLRQLRKVYFYYKKVWGKNK